MDKKNYTSFNDSAKKQQIELGNQNVNRYEEFKDNRSEIVSNREDASINTVRPLRPKENNNDNEAGNNNNNDNSNFVRTVRVNPDSSNLFPVDLNKIAMDCFKTYIKRHRKVKSNFIDNYEIKNLLEVLGIKKNEYEVTAAINKVRMEKPKTFDNEESGYSYENFLEVVKVLKDYRIEDKLLIKAFQTIDKEGEGVINGNKMRALSQSLQLDFSNEEIEDMLGYFRIEEIIKNEVNEIPNEKFSMDFESFCKLYYQG